MIELFESNWLSQGKLQFDANHYYSGNRFSHTSTHTLSIFLSISLPLKSNAPGTNTLINIEVYEAEFYFVEICRTESTQRDYTFLKKKKKKKTLEINDSTA